MSRTYLPENRPNATLSLEHRGVPFHVAVGFDLEGVPRELFGSTRSSGSDFADMLSFACATVSIALKNDIRPAEMSKILGLSPVVGDADKKQEPPSIISTIVAALVEEGWM